MNTYNHLEKRFDQDKFTIKDGCFFPEYLQNKKRLRKKDSKSNLIFKKWLKLGINIQLCDHKKAYPIEFENQLSLDWNHYKTNEIIVFNKYTKKKFKTYLTISDIIKANERAYLKYDRKHKYSYLTEEENNAVAKYTNTIYALPMYHKTNIIRLDIDNHTDKLFNEETQKALYIIMKIFNYAICFIGQSTNNSYHVYIKTDKIVQKQDIENLIKKIKEKDNINCIDFPKYMRTPNSLSYVICDVQSKQDIIKLCKTGQCDNYLIEEEDQLNFIENKMTVASYDAIFSYNKLKQVDQKILSATSCIIRENNQLSTQNNTKTLEEKYNEVEIDCGIRREGTIKMCSYAMHLNYDYKKITNDIYARDRGSKDLKRLSRDKIEKEVKGILQAFSKTFSTTYNKVSNSSCAFISNLQYVPESIIKNIDPLCNEVLSNLDIKKKNKKEKIYPVIKNLLLQMIGTNIRDAENKKINTSSYLTNEQIYSQFSKKWFFLFKEYYHISNCNVYAIFKAIIKLNLFKQEMYTIAKSNKQVSWLYIVHKACKQFYIDTSNDITIIKNTILNYIKIIKNKYSKLCKNILDSIDRYNSKINNIAKVFNYNDDIFQCNTT